jgi:heterotetrameric sarcosine oxidase gamma subunit
VLLIYGPGDGVREGFAAALAGHDLSLVDVSSAWTILRLAGPGAPALLAELSTMALHPEELSDREIVQGPFVNVRAIVRRHDAQVGPGYTMLVPREVAAYAWRAITERGAEHGLRAVGPAAVDRTSGEGTS